MNYTLNFISTPGLGRCVPTSPPTNWQLPTFDDSLWGPVEQASALTGTVPCERLVGSAFLTSSLITAVVPIIPPSAPTYANSQSMRFQVAMPFVPPSQLKVTSITLLGSFNSPTLPGSTDLFFNGVAATSVIYSGFPITDSGNFYATFDPTTAVPGKNILATTNSKPNIPFYWSVQSFILTIEYEYPFGSPDSLAAWLVVNEPGIGLTDRTPYLFKGEGAQHTFNNQVRKRGNANYTMFVSKTNPYTPTYNSPMFLYDETPAGYTCNFAGFIQSFTNRQIGNQGDRFIDVTAVSLESIFDTLYAEPQQFVNQTCGQMVTALFGKYAIGSPIIQGLISDGATIPIFNVPDGTYISDLFTQFATTSGFVWGINPQTQTFYFCLPSAVIAPFVITGNLPLFETITWGYDGADYRNRQGIRLSNDAFTHSVEFFQNDGTGTQQTFQLLRAVDQVVNCWVTLSTPNTAEGIFSGQPNPGDTITTGPAQGSWQGPAHVYSYGGIIVVNGFVQKVTTPSAGGGTAVSGSSQPTFSTITGTTTVDGSVIWTCQGPIGLGTGQETYTFCQDDLSSSSPYNGQWLPTSVYGAFAEVFIVGGMVQQSGGGISGLVEPIWNNTIGGTTGDGTITWTCLGPWLDNTQFGLVLIGANDVQTNQNLVDAINSNIVTRGTTFSLPTWENSQGVAVNASSVGFTFQQKGPGTANVSNLQFTGSAFSWVTGTSPHVTVAATTGGTSPQGSLGSNEGATISLQVYAVGTNTAAPALSFTQGSSVVQLATPLSKGNLCVEYTRPDGNVIEVENTPLIAALAAETYGSGKNQRFSDQSTQGLIDVSSAAGLQFAQQALAAFNVVPQKFSFELFIPGLTPGQEVTFALTGYYSILNGTYFIQEVRGELIPGATFPWINQAVVPGGGHYRYTVSLINIAQIGDYLDFWEGINGGGGSGGGGSAGSNLVATSGGTVPSNGQALTTGGVNDRGASSYTPTALQQAADYGKLISFNDPTTARTYTLQTIPPYAQWNQFIENVGIGPLTVNPGAALLDHSSGGVVIPTNQGIYLSTDGVNYFTSRGLLPASNVGAMFQIATVTVSTLTNKISFPSIPATYNHLQIKFLASGSDGIWQASHVYVLNTIIVVFNTSTTTYYYWKVTTAGTSAGTIPAFATTSSGTLSDGSVVWTNEGADSQPNANISMVFNNDLTGSNYFWAFNQNGASGSVNPVSSVPSSGPTIFTLGTPRNARPAIPASGVIDIPNYKNTGFGKSSVCLNSGQFNLPGSGIQVIAAVGNGYLPLSAIFQIEFYVQDGTYFAAGTQFFLYGIS